jgi:oxygen-independent coproporphyrinogen-3 oxidase
MGLRLAEGLDVARLQAVAGAPLAQALDTAALERLIADGLLEMHGGRLAATAPGRQRLEALLATLVRCS